MEGIWKRHFQRTVYRYGSDEFVLNECQVPAEDLRDEELIEKRFKAEASCQKATTRNSTSVSEKTANYNESHNSDIKRRQVVFESGTPRKQNAEQNALSAE